MMIIVLTMLQFFIGFGLLALLNISLRPGLLISLSLLLGVAVFSLMPFALQLMYIPLTGVNIFLALVLVCILANLKIKKVFSGVRTLFKGPFVLKLYETPALFVIMILIGLSVWRCYYLPPVPRDMTSGPEVIADYAVKEQTMINSVFTVNLESTNNQFKPPYVTSLQIIYKLAGFPFGQLWLSTIFISLIIFLYNVLKQNIHRLVAGLLIIMFLAIPEMYAYTFIALFDYSNAVFFGLSVYFLFQFFDNQKMNFLVLSAMLMGMAVYARSETLILALFFLPLIIARCFKQQHGFAWKISAVVFFLLPSIILYLASVPLFIKFYLPVHYDVAGQVNHHLSDVAPLFERIKTMSSELLFNISTNYYGYLVFVFLAVLAVDICFFRSWSAAATNWIYAILVVYLGLAFIGWLLPLMDLDNSTKRGLMKLFPLMVFYMTNSTALKWVTKKLSNALPTEKIIRQKPTRTPQSKTKKRR